MDKKKKYYAVAAVVGIVIIAVIAYFVVGKYRYGTDTEPAAIQYDNRDDLLGQIKAMEERKAAEGLTWQDTYRLGVMYSHVGRIDDAMKAITEAVGMHPYAKGYEAIGMIHYSRMEYGKAIKNWEKAAELAPSDSEHIKDLIGRAKTGTHMAKRTDVLEDKSKKGGLSWQESFELGTIYLSTRKFDDAVKHLTDAAKAKGDRADMYDTLARAYTFKGDYANAIAAEKKAVELAPKEKLYKARLDELVKFEKAVKASREKGGFFNQPKVVGQKTQPKAATPKPAAKKAEETKPASEAASKP
ncbi:MAG: tetratricopeptide repeat protein [Deltaproteobacteria bacterium]|nr:tetratricopeptide repeat protein [Deltaproteobacteria bacterium]